MSDMATEGVRAANLSPDDVFDLKRVREEITSSVRVAREKGCAIARVFIIDGERVSVRVHPDGRVERLEGGEWRTWPDHPESVV